jgi:hypothetical protein
MTKSFGQAPTAGGQMQQKTVFDVFRHWSRTGKSYCRTRSDVGSERVKFPSCMHRTWHCILGPKSIKNIYIYIYCCHFCIISNNKTHISKIKQNIIFLNCSNSFFVFVFALQLWCPSWACFSIHEDSPAGHHHTYTHTVLRLHP